MPSIEGVFTWSNARQARSYAEESREKIVSKMRRANCEQNAQNKSKF